MSKPKSKIRVSFVGKNAEDVTGSMILIEMSEHKILLEAGLYQSNNSLKDYRINSGRFEFKPKEIDYIFINHGHIDHIGLLPRLYAEGCKAKIIAPKGTSKLFELMGKDSAYIMSRDAESLSKKSGEDIRPIYTDSDVVKCLTYFEEFDYGEIVQMDSTIKFQFVPSGHIINSAQLELWLTESNKTSKILYTSDLGNLDIPKHYIAPFEPVQKANLVIGESTYSKRERSVKQADREKDLEKIKSVIQTVCCENKHKVLIPVFALDRCQNILTILYEMFHDKSGFDIPIIVDSPLAYNITKLYKEFLSEDELNTYQDVMHWNNIKFVEDYETSKYYQQLDKPLIILACSGFMSNGRSRQWAKLLLPDSLSHILFVGYSSEGSLSYKIKKGKVTKTITIDGKAYPNRCNVTDLKSFTSHLTHDGLLKYYSDINCEKIALVHGEFDSKVEFCKELQDEISRKNKCSKVVCVNKTTSILL